MAGDPPTLERLLRRDRAVTITGIVLLCLLAWVYTLAGAGLGMSAPQMTAASLFPHQAAHQASMSHMGPMAGMAAASSGSMQAGPLRWLLTTAMWWVMMIAMMSPSAAPTVLLYARAYRHAAAQGQIAAKQAPTGAFLAGYLMVWLAFSLAAASLQWLLVRWDVVSATMMSSQSRWFSAALLITAGIYQLSPLKQVCLDHCRSPVAFLNQHWRPGWDGAVRLGVIHGAYCVGCCWVLMALLFVGGVMNLVWIAVLTVVVLLEKLAPSGPLVRIGLGIGLVLWGAATIFVPPF